LHERQTHYNISAFEKYLIHNMLKFD